MAWGVGFLLGLRREIRSLSPQDCDLHEDRDWFLCFGRTRMLAFQFLSLFCRRICSIRGRRTVHVWNGAILDWEWPFLNLVLEVSKFYIQAPDLLISNFNPLKLDWKVNVKYWVIIEGMEIPMLCLIVLFPRQ